MRKSPDPMACRAKITLYPNLYSHFPLTFSPKSMTFYPFPYFL